MQAERGQERPSKGEERLVRGATTAKTTRPSASNVLPRERLFAALDAARRASLLWVHGPPGCGKTSLVSSYLDARAEQRHLVPDGRR